jgi:hypothetical protein
MLARLKQTLELKKLNSTGTAHHVLIAILVIAVVAGFGAYQVFNSSAATNYSIGLRETRPVRGSPNLVSGCWLAGRVWSDQATAGEKCKDTCRIEGTALVPRDAKTDRPAYCKGHVAVANENTTQRTCNELHRWWIVNLGCARKANQENSSNAQRHCPNPNFPAYEAGTTVDRCVAPVDNTPPDVVDDTPDDTPTSGLPFFQQNHNNQLDGIRVFQQAPPPRDGSSRIVSRHKYWPATDFATANMNGITDSTWNGGNKWFFAWSNRTNFGTAWNKKPNPPTPPAVVVNGKDCRTTFSTVERANAATRVQIRFALGMSRASYMAPWLALPGTSENDFIADTDYRANYSRHCKTPFSWKGIDYIVMTDKVLLPPTSMTDSVQHKGIVLDYEVQDSRSPAVTEVFIKSIAADCHRMNKKLVLLTNPLNSPAQPQTGLNAENIPRLFDVVDHMTVFLWSGNREGSIPASYDNQLKLLGTLSQQDYKKLILFFELGVPGTTQEDARWVYKKLHERNDTHPKAIMFWRHYADQGEPTATDTNKKISLSLFNRTE